MVFRFRVSRFSDLRFVISGCVDLVVCGNWVLNFIVEFRIFGSLIGGINVNSRFLDFGLVSSKCRVCGIRVFRFSGLCVYGMQLWG